jgi:hypothetical protein
MTDQHDDDAGIFGADCDVLQQPRMDRVVEERVKIEQHEHRRARQRPNMGQHIPGLDIVSLRLQIEIKPLQAIRDGPAVQRPIFGGRAGHRHSGDQFEQAPFIGGFDDHDRRSRAQHEFEVTQFAHRA